MVTKNTFEKSLKQGHLAFVQFGLMSKNHQSFYKKYGVHVNYQNCVISPTISKTNNTLIANYLTSKFGDVWKKYLGFVPYGL